MEKKMKKIITLCCFCSLSACQLLQKKDTPPDLKEKAKLGLFISGVGAEAFSAVPILEKFQEEKINFHLSSGIGWGAWLSAIYAKNQSAEEIKWNLFKLKEQGVFKKRFKNKREKVLKKTIKESLSGPLSIPFACPFLHGKDLIFTFSNSSEKLFYCLQFLPPLFFFSGKTQGSLFSADRALKALLKSSDSVVWIRSKIKTNHSDNIQKVFYRELSAYLNRLQKDIKSSKKIIIIETAPFFPDDFSRLNSIIKTQPAWKEREKIEKLKQMLN